MNFAPAPALLPQVVSSAAALITRLAFGQAFVIAGLGKFMHLENTVKFFTDLGVPAPGLQAPMVAGIEVLGGALLILGLGTRVSALVLAGVMAVATMTADRDATLAALTFMPADKTLTDITPVVFFMAMLWLIAHGAGWLSMDRLISGLRPKVVTQPS